MNIEIKFLNGDLLHLTGSSLQDAIPSIADYLRDIKQLENSFRCVKVIQTTGDDPDTLYGFALITPKSILSLPSLSLSSMDPSLYEMLRECVNESLLHHIFNILDDPVMRASVNEDGQTLESLIWRHLVKNPHTLVVDRIFTRDDLEIWDHRQGMSANPSDRVLDFLFEHPDRIYPQTMLLNSNPRAIDWIIHHVAPDVFHVEQYMNSVKNFLTREAVEWIWANFQHNQNIMECLFMSAPSDALVDIFLEHGPSHHVLLPLSTRPELVPYYLKQLSVYKTILATDISFLVMHPDPRITDWIIEKMDQHVDPEKTEYLENLFEKPSEEILDWVMNEENPHITPNVRKWLLGLNPLPRAQEMYKKMLKEVKIESVDDVSTILVSGTLEMIVLTMDALIENGFPIEEWLIFALHGLSLTNDWESTWEL